VLSADLLHFLYVFFSLSSVQRIPAGEWVGIQNSSVRLTTPHLPEM
jgi:hypothetical protein